MAIGEPTVANVKNAGKEFDNSDEPTEWILTQLFHRYPRNYIDYEVQIKVQLLNQLYYTNIRATKQVAQHIIGLGIDSALHAGLPEVVDQIAKVKIGEKERCHFSFASKYCSWHKPTAYPIYDKYAVACLSFYRDKFAPSAVPKLRDYRNYLSVVTAFRGYFELQSFDFKQLDYYLFSRGKEIDEVRSLKLQSD